MEVAASRPLNRVACRVKQQGMGRASRTSDVAGGEAVTNGRVVRYMEVQQYTAKIESKLNALGVATPNG